MIEALALPAAAAAALLLIMAALWLCGAVAWWTVIVVPVAGTCAAFYAVGLAGALLVSRYADDLL